MNKKNVQITRKLLVPRMTTTGKDVLTPVYNTTDNKFNFYKKGIWRTLD